MSAMDWDDVLVTFEFRNDTAANWTTEDPVLAQGEPGVERDTGRMKVGDGISAWSALGYALSDAPVLAEVDAALTEAEAARAAAQASATTAQTAETGAVAARDAAEGYAADAAQSALDADGVQRINGLSPSETGDLTLAAADVGARPAGDVPQADVVGLLADLAAKADLVGGVIPTAQIPAIATTQRASVASQAEMLALTAEPGDIAVRTDLAVSYMLGATPASTLSNWIALDSASDVNSVNSQTGTVVLAAEDVGARPAGDVPWGEVSGKPATYPPSAHTHPTSQVDGLDAALAARKPTHVGTTAPASPAEGDIWIDTTGL